MAYNYEADRLRKVQEMIMRRNNKTPDGIGIPEFDPNLDKDIGRDKPSNRMAAPLSVMPEDSENLIVMTEGNLPVIDTSNLDRGFGKKGNIFPGGPRERKALMNAYGGTGSENALKAMAEDERLMKEPARQGVVGPASPLAQGLAELEIVKRDRLEKQMRMRDPRDYYNPPQRKVSVGQLLGKGG